MVLIRIKKGVWGREGEIRIDLNGCKLCNFRVRMDFKDYLV